MARARFFIGLLKLAVRIRIYLVSVDSFKKKTSLKEIECNHVMLQSEEKKKIKKLSEMTSFHGTKKLC